MIDGYTKTFSVSDMLRQEVLFSHGDSSALRTAFERFFYAPVEVLRSDDGIILLLCGMRAAICACRDLKGEMAMREFENLVNVALDRCHREIVEPLMNGVKTVPEVLAAMRQGCVPAHRRDEEILRFYADCFERAYKLEKEKERE